MKIRATLAGLLVLAAALVSGGGRLQAPADKAVVTFIYGTVETRHGASGWKPAALNEVLRPGDAIRTKDDARAEVQIGRGRYVRLDENTHLLITRLDASGVARIKALIGNVWVTIERAITGPTKFEVEMPSAVASVKGTVFRCAVTDEGEETYVYDGEVEVMAGGQRAAVQPGKFARLRRGAKLALANFNLDEDDRRQWVQYCRFRDICRHLGNPTVLVALAEAGQGRTEASVGASAVMAAALRRLGFPGAALAPEHVPHVALGPDGVPRFRQRPKADYVVVGKVAVREVAGGDGQMTVRAEGSVSWNWPGHGKLATATAVATGRGRDFDAAKRAALNALSVRLAAELAPRAVRAIVGRRGGVRVEAATPCSREQLMAVRRALATMPGVYRVVPLRLPGTRVALVVAGKPSAQAVAGYLGGAGRGLIQWARVRDGVVYVSFAKPRGPQARSGGGRFFGAGAGPGAPASRAGRRGLGPQGR